MSTDLFSQLQADAHSQGSAAALASLADRLKEAGQHHELFDVRLMQARLRLGLPIIVTTSLEDMPEAVRTQMEEAYLAACREVGDMLLTAGQVREAWMYLRPVGDKTAMATALEKLPAAEHYEAIIEIALHEGVDPPLGFRMVLEHMGLCNAITLFDGAMQERPRAQRQAVTAMLIAEIHRELFASLKTTIQRELGRPPEGSTIAELVRDRDWLFAEDNYHVDTTHLNAVVRFALAVDDPAAVRQALDLTEYGRHLAPAFQFAGEPPFEDMYVDAARFFRALLGEDVEATAAHFRERAETSDLEEVGTGPAETYVSLLARLGRHAEAVEAAGRLLPRGTRTSGFAPSLLELASQGRQHARLMEICRAKNDLVGFAAGLIEQQVLANGR